MDVKMQQTKAELVQSLVESATLFQRIIATFWSVKLGNFVPLGYTGPTTFYLFKCCCCKQLSADHPHGYGDLFGEGRLYCHLCKD